MHYTFQYRIIGKSADEWHSKSRTWKTRLGAQKAADTWTMGMLANECPVVCRLGKIVDNHFVPVA